MLGGVVPFDGRCIVMLCQFMTHGLGLTCEWQCKRVTSIFASVGDVDVIDC